MLATDYSQPSIRTREPPGPLRTSGPPSTWPCSPARSRPGTPSPPGTYPMRSSGSPPTGTPCRPWSRAAIPAAAGTRAQNERNARPEAKRSRGLHYLTIARSCQTPASDTRASPQVTAMRGRAARCRELRSTGF